MQPQKDWKKLGKMALAWLRDRLLDEFAAQVLQPIIALFLDCASRLVALIGDALKSFFC